MLRDKKKNKEKDRDRDRNKEKDQDKSLNKEKVKEIQSMTENTLEVGQERKIIRNKNPANKVIERRTNQSLLLR